MTKRPCLPSIVPVAAPHSHGLQQYRGIHAYEFRLIVLLLGRYCLFGSRIHNPPQFVQLSSGDQSALGPRLA
jgi:hypothetical protein